jgi:Holliday junction DNA helicase RuvA
VIASLRGRWKIDEGDSIVVDVGGVGYLVQPTAATLGALPPETEEVTLLVHTHFVADEPLRLYGFADAGERRLFQTLLSVQGVGPRVALAILAGLDRAELVRAIATGDANRLTQIKGVGRKIADRLALELREKILTLPAAAGKPAAPQAGAGAGGRAPAGPLGDVYGVLAQLGYKPAEIEPLLETMDPARPVEELVREALGALRKR